MIRLRPQQLKALDQSASDRFRAAYREHALKFWPDACAALGAEALEARIDNGVELASEFEITSERDTARFLDLFFVWGDAFPDGPATPWAKEILGDATLDGRLRVHQLSVRTTQELQQAEAAKA